LCCDMSCYLHILPCVPTRRSSDLYHGKMHRAFHERCQIADHLLNVSKVTHENPLFYLHKWLVKSLFVEVNFVAFQFVLRMQLLNQAELCGQFLFQLLSIRSEERRVGKEIK